MIEKITLHNFQAHKSTELELGQVTILRGPSDSGKSSVVRALNAFFNCNIKPEQAFKGEYPVEIAIYADGDVVTMTRNSKTTTYVLGDKEFSKTNKKCPDEVKEFLGIKEYQIDTDEKIFLQIQSQNDKHFLLSESPSTIAKIIGRLSNLNIVLCASREMYADSLSEKQNIKLLLEQQKDAERDLMSFRHLDDFKGLLDRANERAERLDKDAALLDEYKSLIATIEAIEPKLKKEEKLKKAIDATLDESLPGVLAAMERIKEFEELEEASNVLSKEIPETHIGDIPEHIGELIEKMSRCDEMNTTLKEFEAFKLRASKLKVVDVVPAYKKADEIIAALGTLEAYMSVITVCEEFNSSIKKFKAKLSELGAAEVEFKNTLANSLPEQCKTCSLLGL